MFDASPLAVGATARLRCTVPTRTGDGDVIGFARGCHVTVVGFDRDRVLVAQDGAGERRIEAAVFADQLDPLP